MKKFLDWLDNWVPYAWSVLWIFIITGASVAVAVEVAKWALSLLGVQ